MTATKQISLFKDFFNNALTGTEKILPIDVMELSKFSPDLADHVLEEPKDALRLIETAIADFDCYSERKDDLPQISFINVPEEQEKRINELRTKHLNKLICLKGVLVSKSEIRPRVISARFECPACGNILNVIQESNKIKQPSSCGCGRKGQFKLIHKEMIDAMGLVLEELPERSGGSDTARLNVYLERYLCDTEHKLNLGARIEVVGYLQEVPIILRQGGQSTRFDWILSATSYRNMDFVDISTEITPEEEELFKEIQNHHNPARLISKWLFPDIVGKKKAKELLIYQQFGGTTWAGRRDYIHILQYGDPGTGKSDMAFKVAPINPISKIAVGTHTSGVGLTAALERDELTKRYTIRAGLLARCNGGLAVIDELEKMSDQDKRCLHLPMESGFLPVEKGGISAKLVTKTAILATANRKVVGKDEKVVDLPDAILDRFDFLLEFSDIPSTTSDEKVASSIIDRATFDGSSTTFSRNSTTFQHNDTTFYIVSISKYIVKSKKVSPIFSRRVKKTLYTWYSAIREASTKAGYDHKKPTARTVESILRLARAICRSKLKDTVTIIELKLAISYFDFVYGKYTRPEYIDI